MITYGNLFLFIFLFAPLGLWSFYSLRFMIRYLKSPTDEKPDVPSYAILYVAFTGVTILTLIVLYVIEPLFQLLFVFWNEPII